MRAQIRKSKIQEALELLNEAAEEKKEEVYDVIGDKYESLRDILKHTLHNGQEVASTAQKRVSKTVHAEEKKIHDAAVRWEKKIQKEPWKYLGGIAIGSLALGWLLAHRK